MPRLPIWSIRGASPASCTTPPCVRSVRRDRGRRLELRASVGLVSKHQGSWHLPYAPGPRTAHPRPANARPRGAGCQRHTLAVPFRAQARGSHSRMCPAAYLGRHRPRPPGGSEPTRGFRRPFGLTGTSQSMRYARAPAEPGEATCAVHRSPRSASRSRSCWRAAGSDRCKDARPSPCSVPCISPGSVAPEMRARPRRVLIT